MSKQITTSEINKIMLIIIVILIVITVLMTAPAWNEITCQGNYAFGQCWTY